MNAVIVTKLHEQFSNGKLIGKKHDNYYCMEREEGGKPKKMKKNTLCKMYNW